MNDDVDNHVDSNEMTIIWDKDQSRGSRKREQTIEKPLTKRGNDVILWDRTK